MRSRGLVGIASASCLPRFSSFSLRPSKSFGLPSVKLSCTFPIQIEQLRELEIFCFDETEQFASDFRETNQTNRERVAKNCNFDHPNLA